MLKNQEAQTYLNLEFAQVMIYFWNSWTTFSSVYYFDVM